MRSTRSSAVFPVQDDSLRELFQELREEERAAVPRFAVPARRPVNRRPLLALAVVVLTALAVVFPRHSPRFTSADRAAARSIAAWRPPTDFLLRTPGHELLTSMPSIPSKGVSR